MADLFDVRQNPDECEAAFQQLKEHLSCPSILCQPIHGKPLKLYVTVTDRAISAALMQDQGEDQKPIYFVSKTLRGAEVRYQKIEKVALAVIFSTRSATIFRHIRSR